jgi:hypothetical protein
MSENVSSEAHAEILGGKAVSMRTPAKELGIRTPMKAIRAKCVDCCCGNAMEVRECTVKSCALWPYRMGRYPKAS